MSHKVLYGAEVSEVDSATKPLWKLRNETRLSPSSRMSQRRTSPKGDAGICPSALLFFSSLSRSPATNSIPPHDAHTHARRRAHTERHAGARTYAHLLTRFHAHRRQDTPAQKQFGFWSLVVSPSKCLITMPAKMITYRFFFLRA